MNKTLKRTVAVQMTSIGWNIVDSLSFECTTAVAERTYQTAVGPKKAIAYLNPAADSGVTLVADYQSEGRNILSTTTFYVGVDMEPSTVESGITQFCNAVDAAVAESYAARLLARA